MAPSKKDDPPVFQEFTTKDRTPLKSLRTHLCAERDERDFFWSDIQSAFEGIKFLEVGLSKKKTLFTIAHEGEL